MNLDLKCSPVSLRKLDLSLKTSDNLEYKELTKVSRNLG